MSDKTEEDIVSVTEPLPPESDDGNVEYKQQLLNVDDERLEQLATQMNYRLSEGYGECIYEIAIHDSGVPLGLSPEHMDESLRTLEKICAKIDAVMTLTTRKIISRKKEPVKEIAEVLIREDRGKKFVHTKICALGSVDHGKSTLLGVLTNGVLDNGNGSARSTICTLKHELQTGKTSSIGMHIMGFDAHGNPISSADRFKSLTWEEITSKSRKVVTFIDLCGHRDYLRTTIKGVSGTLPDYAMIVIEGSGGITDMTIEHIKLCGIYRIPFFIVVTKVDIAPPDKLKETITELKRLPKTMRIRNRISSQIKDNDDIAFCIKNFKSFDGVVPIIPYLKISSKTGEGLDNLRSFINLLPPRRPTGVSDDPDDAEFSVLNTYWVHGVGTIVHGNLLNGRINTGQKLWLGPDSTGNFRKVHVKSIHFKRNLVDTSTAIDDYCYALRDVSRSSIRKGMFMMATKDGLSIAKRMKCELIIQTHHTTIKPGYEAQMHLDNINQQVSLVSILRYKRPRDEEWQDVNDGDDSYLRSGVRSEVIFEFKYNPENVKVGSRFLTREGKTMAFGSVLELLD